MDAKSSDDKSLGDQPHDNEAQYDIDEEKETQSEQNMPQDNGAAELQLQPQESRPQYSVFTTRQKQALVLAASVTSFFSPLSAQIYLPALNDIADDLNVTSSQINLTITTYMIFQGIVPMFIGSLADSGGRRPAYIACFVIYIGANIGVALAPNYGAVLGLRCLQSAGSSSTVALCTAVVADIVTSAERGQYIGFTVVPIVLAPSLGPVIGGLLSQSLGWRWIFWFLTIIAGVTLVLLILFFPETCRHIVGDGSITPPRSYQTVWQMFKRRSSRGLSRTSSQGSKGETKFKFKPPNILESLFMLFEIETGLLLGASSIIFAGFYCVATAMPTLFAANYGYNEIEVGLMYLPLAAGSVGAGFLAGPLMNWNYKRHCAKLGLPFERKAQQDLSNFPIERARLEIGLPLLVLSAASLIAWGWAMDADTHVAVPCVLSSLLGVGMIGFNNTSNVLLVDTHPGKAGTATAANNLTRCLLGAGASAAIVPMMNAMGVGWAFTLVGALYVLTVPVFLALMVWGMKWRKQQADKDERKKQAKAEKKQANAA